MSTREVGIVQNPQARKRRDQTQSAKGENRPRRTQKQLRAVDLADVPIEDPCYEIRLIQNGDVLRLLEYLNPGKVTAMILPQDLETRIIEIYRRCYEKEPDREKCDESIIRDFVAAFPGLTFKAEWLRKLVDTQARMGDFKPKSLRSRVLLAMANGFRGAVEVVPRYQKSLNRVKVKCARDFRREILLDLQQWERVLDRRHADHTEGAWNAEVAGRAADKAASLIEKHPSLKTCKQKLRELLRTGQQRKASFLIATTVWLVSEHDLQRKRT
jgi:hypothetical protein